MAITTRETTATGVTNKGAPLTNAEVDTNFIELVQTKVDVSGAIIFAAKAGEALAKGEVVYVSGVSGNTPVVSKADANDASKMPAYGLAEDAASLNAAVNIVTFGTLYDFDTSSFSAGDTVYVSNTAGAITSTAPATESSLLQNIGTVIRPHASAGSIKVGGAGRTNATPNLNDGNVFIGNGSDKAVARSLTGDDISGGTITSFASTGIDDNATSTAITIDSSQNAAFSGNITLSGTVDGRDIATDGTKLDGIESGATADQTNAEIRAAVEAASDSNVFTDADHTKLNGIEASADVTDAANVTAAGALMDSEVTNLAEVKAFDSSDYATAAQGTTADSALQNVVEDTTPQLGGNLDFNGNLATSFTSTGIDDNANATAITIDASENVGIGTASPRSVLDLINTSGEAAVLVDSRATDNEVSRLSLLTKTAGANTGGVLQHSGGVLSLSNATNLATKHVTIDSSGRVGINNQSPIYTLEVTNNQGAYAPAARFLSDGDAVNWARVDIENVNAGVPFILYQDNSGAVGVRNEANQPMFFSTNAQTRMTIGSSGSVGIGTSSPTAGYLLDVEGDMTVGDGSSSFNTLAIQSGAATVGRILFNDGAISGQIRYDHSTDAMEFRTSNTEAMRIDASGNVGIGASPSTLLEVASTAPTLRITNTTNKSWSSGDAVTNLSFYGTDTSQPQEVAFINTVAGANSAIVTGELLFGTSNGTGSATERMRIDTSGNVGIGTDAPSSLAKLDVVGDGIRVYNGTSVTTGFIENRADTTDLRTVFGNGALTFSTGASATGTERMRVDNAGNLLVGTTDPSPNSTFSSRLVVSTESGVAGIQVDAFQTSLTTAASFTNANGLVGRITTTGSVTAYNTSSDERLKENIVDAPAGNIDSIRVRSFDWKADGSHQTYGMVAQELVDVAPEAVSQGQTEEDMWGVDYSKLVPMMIKEIQDLKAEVAALKGA